jgi:hypothetical protein
MSNVEVTAPKHRVIGVPFAKGVSGNPAGRPRGARSKLSENFIADLRECWERHGVEALEKVAKEQPEVLIRAISALMPRDVNLSIGIDVASFADRFAQAAALLDNEPAPRLPRPRLPGQPRTIEHHE